MEAMVVVAIIGITAALAAPALSIAMADRRAGEASHSLVRIGARARSEAMAYGRAHLLVYGTGSGPNGSVQLWRGVSNLCSANNWGAIVTGACGSGGSPNCVDVLDMAAYDHGTHQVRMQLQGAPGGAFLCFQPDGELLVSVGGGNFSPTAPAGADAVRFRIDRLVNGGVEGVSRTVVFPFGGTPRIAR